MRNKCVLMVFCVFFFFSGNVYGEITGKIIVRGKWGNTPGEFGLDISEPPGAGPSIFTVSPNGDIYIADCVNSRIVVYSHKGEILKNIKIPSQYHRYHCVNSIEVDSNGFIYYTDEEGLHVIGSDDNELTILKGLFGRLRIDKGKIYIWVSGGNYGKTIECVYDHKKRGLSITKEIDGLPVFSNGNRFDNPTKSQLKNKEIAMIKVNDKAKPIRELVKGKEEPIRIDTSNPWKNLSDFSIVDGNDGNAYLENWGYFIKINSEAVLIGKFVPTDDDLRYRAAIPYASSGDVRVKKGKIYSMGATDEEFMIIEYEFEPVE